VLPFSQTALRAPQVAVSAVGKRITGLWPALQSLMKGVVNSTPHGLSAMSPISVMASTSATISWAAAPAIAQVAVTCMSVQSVVPSHTAIPQPLVDELHTVVTPFNTEAFRQLLIQYNILNKFPNIFQNLTTSFSIFNSSPTISEVFTPPNCKSVFEHADFVNQYFATESKLQHIMGPYTREQAQDIFKENGGFFRSSPIGVVPKPQRPDQLWDSFRMVIDLSACDSHSVSVNSLINADDFLARWDGARVKGDYVSCCSSYSPPCMAMYCWCQPLC
jgi:hypothetical protein